MQLDDERTQPHPIVSERSSSSRAMLEPVSEDAHPADQRRVPTHPELLSEALAAIAAGPRPSVTPERTSPEPATPTNPRIGPNRSPSPLPIRTGLFSTDRITNLLASAAIGLALTIIPARKLARAHGQAALVQPLLELTDSIEHPLGVDAGLLRQPQAIAAEIEEVRAATQTRYLSIWLLAGLALGLGLGFVPRWWA